MVTAIVSSSSEEEEEDVQVISDVENDNSEDESQVSTEIDDTGQ